MLKMIILLLIVILMMIMIIVVLYSLLLWGQEQLPHPLLPRRLDLPVLPLHLQAATSTTTIASIIIIIITIITILILICYYQLSVIIIIFTTIIIIAIIIVITRWGWGWHLGGGSSWTPRASRPSTAVLISGGQADPLNMLMSFANSLNCYPSAKQQSETSGRVGSGQPAMVTVLMAVDLRDHGTGSCPY